MLLVRTGRSAAFLSFQIRSNNRARRQQLCSTMASTTTTPSNSTTSSSAATKSVQAKLVSRRELDACGERLRQGELVAFPTETVYGLGCHALDEAAIHKVFAAKERPLTDPLIVHVPSFADASKLWEQQQTSRQVLETLCLHFWPGPLTLVAKAAPEVVPQIVMAHTGFVACRSPQHALAQELLQVAQVPIAAPSANKFGHVSPTRAQHVWDDLLHENVWIVEDDDESENHVSCNVGVESTVAKLTSNESGGGGVVTVLRQGAISAQQLQDCLQKAGLSDAYRVELNTKKATADHVATVAPGQTIRHYSPNIPSYMVTKKCIDSTADVDRLSSAVVIDYGGRLAAWKPHTLAYRDLSPSGKSEEAAQAVFETLRWAERVEGGSLVLFPQLEDTSEPLMLAVQDRLTRAASGVSIDSLLETTSK